MRGSEDGPSPARSHPTPSRPCRARRGQTARRRFALRLALLMPGLCMALPPAAGAQDRPTYSTYGTPGLIDMPTAEMPPDGELALSSAYHDGSLKNTLTFQIWPRVTGTFRYSWFQEYLSSGQDLYDRSFDLAVLLFDEGSWTPAVAIGLRDFGGTGVLASEYVVGTKHLGRGVTVSGGIGWGRLGTYGSFDNPLGVISDAFDRRGGFDGIEETGQVSFDSFFRGPAALFGGIEWRPNERLSFKAEYSSDDYETEVERMGFERRTPLNFAATWRTPRGVDLTAYALHGAQFGMVATLAFDPGRAVFPSGREPAPPPVYRIDPVSAAAGASWGQAGAGGRPVVDVTLNEMARQALDAQRITLDFLTIEGDAATARIQAGAYDSEAQAIGRTARTLTRTLPPEIGIFNIVLVRQGLPLSSVRIRRADMEELEFAPDNSWQSFARAQFSDASALSSLSAPGEVTTYPAFDWRLSTYLSPSYFDPDQPVRADFGAQLSFGVDLAPGVILSTSLRQKIVGNLDEVDRRSDSVLPHVRSDYALYDRTEGLEMTHLTGEYFFRPGTDLYGRMTAGYLERMYAGLSTELLWKPVDSPLALGAEINHVTQRDYDTGFGLLDYEVTTGHVSAYYDFGKGYLGQVDAGRYLAGDWGATFSLDREFGNGFTMGAFFTLTDVSFDDFGEGSFDKGIRFVVPLSWIAGEPSNRALAQTIRPTTRDGGQRLTVRNRLYGLVRDTHAPEMQDDWGRFWR